MTMIHKTVGGNSTFQIDFEEARAPEVNCEFPPTIVWIFLIFWFVLADAIFNILNDMEPPLICAQFLIIRAIFDAENYIFL